jgi:NAD(P)H dehydrogenase (quinone)
MSKTSPILVTGATGRVGGVGRTVVALLRRQGHPVRALVHHDDERADELRAQGAEVVVCDLTDGPQVLRAVEGCRRMYLGLGLTPEYLTATVMVAAVARERGLEALVNISQLTVSEMSLEWMTDSQQQRQHWMAEHVLTWSGLPVVEIRPTIFFENPLFSVVAAESILEDNTIRLPFGEGRTSPIAAHDVAEVVATVLAEPSPHIGKVYELTGPVSQDMHGVANEYSHALGRSIMYVDVPFEEWKDSMRTRGFPEHVRDHLVTMARLHADNHYDRLTHDVDQLLHRPATSITELVRERAALLTPSQSPGRRRRASAARV